MSRSGKQREKEAKEKLDKLKDRSKAADLMHDAAHNSGARPKVIGNKKADDAKKTTRRKLKSDEFESEEFELKIGQKVLYEGEYYVVNQLHCPNNTIGIVNKNQFLFVKPNRVNLNEGVLGMTGIPELNRFLALAGLPTNELTEEDKGMEVSDSSDVDFDEPLDEPESDRIERTDSPLPPRSIEEPLQSDEFQQAISMLDEVHQLVTGMKLSEYKIFVQRLEDFTQRIQRLGREYLK